MADDGWLGTGTEALVGGTLAAIGAAVGGPIVAGLTQAATPILTRSLSVDRLRNRSADQVSDTIMAAAELCGVPPTELAVSLFENRNGAKLLVTALRSAADAIAEEKILYLAHCIASAHDAGADCVDMEQFFVDAIRPLEAIHIRVLAHLAGKPDERPIRFEGLSLEQLRACFPSLAAVMEPTLAVLERTALIQRHNGPGDRPYTYQDLEAPRPGKPTWSISDFGQQVFERLFLSRESSKHT